MNRKLISLDSVVPEPISFLWRPYIPLRKLIGLSGDPEAGKTWVALTVAAAVSSGIPLPGEEECREPSTVLYLTAEDGIADTIRPRLDRLGADASKVYTMAGRAASDPSSLALASDIDQIREAANEIHPALVVFDPIQGFLGGRPDMNRANEVRPILANLMRVAEEFNFAAVLIGHLNKGTRERSLYRMLGSVDFPAAFRSVLFVAKDPNREDRRILVHGKCSFTELGPSLAFAIGDDGFRWDGTSNLTAADVLGPELDSAARSEIDEATDFLYTLLQSSGGAKKAGEVHNAAHAAGISRPTLFRAKSRLGIKSDHIGGRDGYWIWRLPEELPPDTP